MNTKMFLSLLAAGSFCVVAPAQAQQQTPTGKTSGAQPATKQTAGKASKQAPAASNKATGKTANAGAKPSGPQQKVELVMGSTGLSPTAINVSAGSVVLNIRNNSDKPHKIVLEGGTMKKVEAPVSVAGSGNITGDLTPGTYRLSCQLGGHMESAAKVTVK
jgi:plastocyanin